MRRLRVRCCCKPRKVFGTLPWSEKGSKVRFWLRQPSPNLLSSEPVPNELAAIELQVEKFVDGEFEELAFKSMDLPIEIFRKIPGFIEGDL